MLSYWSSSSGLTSGAKADVLCNKDDNGLPYIPGKTIRGLFSEHLKLLCDTLYTDSSEIAEKGIDKIVTMGENQYSFNCHFSNVTLSKEEQDAINQQGLAQWAFETVSQTAINDYGSAKSHSLRTIEVAVPITLYGSINSMAQTSTVQFNNHQIDFISNCGKMVRRLGYKRNVGLGRCQFSLLNSPTDD